MDEGNHIPVYESLSEDEGDKHDVTEPSQPTDPTIKGSVKPEKKCKGTKRKTSKVWDSLEELPKGTDNQLRVRCLKCGYICGYNSANGTGNMLKHQKRCIHTGDIKQLILSNSQGSLSVREGVFDPRVFRDMIAYAVVRHNLPLQFVEYEGIKEAFLYANQRATLITRNTLKSDILALYKYEKKQLFNMFKNYSGRVCLTSDLWTSVATDGYITIAAHYISDDWVLHKKLLNFAYMPSPHTGITIADKIYKLVCDWNIESKLFSITLDNAASNDAFVNILRTQLNLRDALINNGQFFHIRCCAHILNLIVQEGLKDMDASVFKVRESVKYIKGSGSQGRKEKFKEWIEQVALNKSKG